MNILGYPVMEGDTVHSASMGSGRVDSVPAQGLYVNHSGQRWRYNNAGIRSGCKFSDLTWRPMLLGLQIKDSESYSTAGAVLAEITLSLRSHYG